MEKPFFTPAQKRKIREVVISPITVYLRNNLRLTPAQRRRKDFTQVLLQEIQRVVDAEDAKRQDCP